MVDPDCRQFVVYLLTCVPTGQGYVGITVLTLPKRWRQHVNLAHRGLRGGALQQAIVMHGEDAFEAVTIRTVIGVDAACAAEREEIATRKTLHPLGLNMNEGGEVRAGFRVSQATLEKMRESAAGRVITEATKVKISAKVRALWADPIYRARMTAALSAPHVKEAFARSGRRLGLQYGGLMLGKTHTEESREKIGAAAKGRVPHNKGKPMLPHVKESLAEHHRARAAAGLPGYRKGQKASEQTLEKQKASRRGMRHTDEARAKIAAAGRARGPISEATRAKMVIAAQIKASRPMSDETRNKIRLAAIRQFADPAQREAARQRGLERGRIARGEV